MGAYLREFICTLSGPESDFSGLAALRLSEDKLWFSVDLPWKEDVTAAAVVAADPGRPFRIALVDHARSTESTSLFGCVEGPELRELDAGASHGRSYDLEIVTGSHRLAGRLREVGARAL